MNRFINLEKLEILPARTSLYISPILWKGDPIGHVGQNDVFFFLLEGECYLSIDGETHILRRGQLAFLPKGKTRRYTQISGSFALYEISFDVRYESESLMSVLGLADGDFVVDPPDLDELKQLFESSARVEMMKDPIHSISAYANALAIIKIYAEARASRRIDERSRFSAVISYMNERMSDEITLGELADAACMHPTYFVRKFGQAFGMPPMAYLNRLRIYKAMGLLFETDLSIEEIAELVGIRERSYFARVFRKHAGATPSEYRAAFL